MNKRLIIKTILIFMLICTGITLSIPFYLVDPVKVNISISRVSPFIGQAIHYKIKVISRRGVKIRSITVNGFPDGIILIDKKRYAYRSIFFKNDILIYSLIPTSTGEVVLPPAVVTYAGPDDAVEETNAVSCGAPNINVRSTLSADFDDSVQKIKIVDGAAISTDLPQRSGGINTHENTKEIEGFIRLPISDRMRPRTMFVLEDYNALIYLLILLLFLILGYSLFKRLLKEKKEKPLSGIEAIYKRLEIMDDPIGRVTSGDKEFYDEFYSLFLLILRYKYGIPLQEMTSEELIENVSSLDIPLEERAYIIDLIKVCESIRYVPVPPKEPPEIFDIGRLKGFISENNIERSKSIYLKESL